MSKIVFNIKNYDNYAENDIAMHCKTPTQAKLFLKYLDSIGETWCSGKSYLEESNWEIYGKDTIYYFKEKTFEDIESAKIKNVKILECTDFVFEMNKNGYINKNQIKQVRACCTHFTINIDLIDLPNIEISFSSKDKRDYVFRCLLDEINNKDRLINIHSFVKGKGNHYDLQNEDTKFAFYGRL